MSKQILVASLPPSLLVKESSCLVPSPLQWTLQHRVWVGVSFPQFLILVLPQTFWLTVLWSFGLLISGFPDNHIVLSLLFLSYSPPPLMTRQVQCDLFRIFLAFSSPIITKTLLNHTLGIVMSSIFVHLVPKAQDWRHIWSLCRGTWPLWIKLLIWLS